MPRVVITDPARKGLVSCRQFLQTKSPFAAKRATESIRKALKQLETNPDMGRGQGPFQELVIPFGSSGYIALYLFDKDNDKVIILGFKYQRQSDD